MLLHTNSIPQHCPTGKGAGGIYSHDANTLAKLTGMCSEPIGDRALSSPGRAGNTNAMGFAKQRVDSFHNVWDLRAISFNL
jgi:hypothetical protein